MQTQTPCVTGTEAGSAAPENPINTSAVSPQVSHGFIKQFEATKRRNIKGGWQKGELPLKVGVHGL